MGTKEKFRNWLMGKGMTYTRYTTLSIEQKRTLWTEYERGGRAAKAPQPDKTATEEIEPVNA